MAKSESLMLDGQVFNPNGPTPRLVHIKKFLDRSASNALFGAPSLCKICGCSEKATHAFARRDEFERYVYRNGNANVFGNPKAIARMSKQLEGDN